MRNYFALYYKKLTFIFTILLLTTFYSSTSYATDYTNCNCQQELQNGNFTCNNKSFSCNGTDVCTENWDDPFSSNSDSFDIACVERSKLGVSCTCNNPGIIGSANSGMTCRDSQGTLSYPVYCKNSAYACVNGADKSLYLTDGITKVNGSGQTDYDTRFKKHFATGVSCEGKAEIKQDIKVTCQCENPGKTGAGNNGFTCTGQGNGNDGNKYSIYCDDSDAACVQGTDKSIYLYEPDIMVKGRNSDYDDNFKGKTASGISCEKANQYPPDVPPPSPPCKYDKGWVNGQCTGFITALGELGTDATSFTTKLFAILLSFSGGIALLLIIRAGYNMITSRGNPQKVQEARDQLIAAIVGLVFLIFSFVLLQVIGYDILRVPGFSNTNSSGGQGQGCRSNADCSGGMTCDFNGTIGKCN